MTTMIEKVARALIEVQIRSANELFKLSDPRRVRTEEQIIASIDTGWRMNAKDARAAIEAMREPAPAAIAAGELEYSTIYFAEEEISSHHLVELVFRSIIDAALSEEKAE